MAKTVLFATFSVWLKGKRTPINGMVEPMLSYLLPRGYQVDLIDGLHPESSNVVTLFEYYKDRSPTKSVSWVSLLLMPFLKLQNTNATQIVFKLRDFLSVFELALLKKRSYDLFIGLESVYTMAGILLKRLGRVKTVIYYVSDYSPSRYPHKVFNDFYLWLDRFCCYHADYIWDVSRAFQPARIETGLRKNHSRPVIHVPNALFPKQICPLPTALRLPYSLVYAGTLNIWNGPDVAVEAIAYVRQKFPQARLHIYGTNGKDQARVEVAINRLHLKDSVVFYGFIGDVVALSHAINHYMLGLAPYRTLKGSHRAYGDATKLRLYMGAGLPPITTPVPPLGQEVKNFGAGLICKDDPKELAKEIIKVFSNDSFYKNLVTKTTQFARNNTWQNTYDDAFRAMALKS